MPQRKKPSKRTGGSGPGKGSGSRTQARPLPRSKAALKAKKLPKDLNALRAMALAIEQRRQTAWAILAARGKITVKIIPMLSSIHPGTIQGRGHEGRGHEGSPASGPASGPNESWNSEREQRRLGINFTGQAQATTLKQHQALVRCLERGEDLLRSRHPEVELHNAIEETRSPGSPAREWPKGFRKAFLDPQYMEALQKLLQGIAKNPTPAEAAKAAAWIPHVLAPWADPARNLLASHLVVLSAAKLSSKTSKKNPDWAPWMPKTSVLAEYECAAALAAQDDLELAEAEIGTLQKLIEDDIEAAREDRDSAFLRVRSPKEPVYLAACGRELTRAGLKEAVQAAIP